MIYLKQTATGNVTTGTPVQAVFTNPVDINSLIVVGWASAAGTFSTISDTLTTTWNLIDSSTTPTSRLYYGSPTSSGANTVSVATTGNATSVIIAREYIFNKQPVPVVDQHTVATGTASNSASSGASGTTTNNYELVIGSCATTNASTAYTLGTGFSHLSTSTATAISLGMEDLIVIGQKATQTATFTLTLNPNWNCYVATFGGARSSFIANLLRPAIFKPGLAR